MTKKLFFFLNFKKKYYYCTVFVTNYLHILYKLTTKMSSYKVNNEKNVVGEDENTEMPFWLRMVFFLLFLGWVIFASVTLSKFDELSGEEKDDLDEVCYIILVIQLVILVLSMLFVLCSQIVGGGLPFLINIF
mgnify:CR=1 FL=1